MPAVTTDVPSQSGVKSWRRQLVVQSVYKAYVFFISVEEKHSLVRLVLKLTSRGSRIDWVG